MIKNPKALAISNLINDCSYGPREVGIELSTDHRYLQSQFGRTAMSFFGCLAENYEKGWYDARNEYECKCAKIMIDALRDAGLWHDEFEARIRREHLENLY